MHWYAAVVLNGSKPRRAQAPSHFNPACLQEMSDMAALLEADLQTANAAAKEKSIQKERDDAKALERQQEAERKEAALLKELAVRGESERALQVGASGLA